MRSAFCVSAVAILASVLGAPTAVSIIKRAGPVKPDSYIIGIKENTPLESVISALTSGFTSGSSITHTYTLIPAFTASLKGTDLNFVRQLASIEYIEQDGIASINYEAGVDGEAAVVERDDVPLREVVRRQQSVPGKQDGEGVVVYGIDTGIYTQHSCFGGRASWGATFDGNGHGTHTAGTVAGEVYGVATKAKIIAVKVLGDDGSGAISDVISGVEYAHSQYLSKPNTPAIATMSLGGSIDITLNKAVKKAIKQGLHFTIAAGNSNLPTITSSPANVPEAITVGAVDSNKKKASFSNFGLLVDIWAPGVDITSAWIGNPDAKNTISGTSMATPYVAGISAVALGKYGQMSPAALSKELKAHAEPSVTGALLSTKVFAKIW